MSFLRRSFVLRQFERRAGAASAPIRIRPLASLPLARFIPSRWNSRMRPSTVSPYPVQVALAVARIPSKPFSRNISGSRDTRRTADIKRKQNPRKKSAADIVFLMRAFFLLRPRRLLL